MNPPKGHPNDHEWTRNDRNDASWFKTDAKIILERPQAWPHNHPNLRPKMIVKGPKSELTMSLELPSKNNPQI